jgi:hypothetical protein
MSFTRVEQNGVEFYTLNATGESGMSISGLARLCGVRHQALVQVLQRIPARKTQSKWLQPLVEKDLHLQVNSVSGAKILTAEVCTAIIGYYAFESRNRTKEAQYAFEKFAHMGMERWIQNTTNWNPTLPSAFTHESVRKYINDHLKPNLISATGLRIYFYLEMKMLQEEEPTLSTICADLNISPATFKKWLPQIQEWSSVAHWLDLTKRQGPERAIQERLHQELGGEMEAWTAIGPVDLVTPTEIIEIKRIEDWKTAVGQVLTKSQTYPQHKKRIHLFGESSQQLKKIISNCQAFEVVVTFERLNLKTAAV